MSESSHATSESERARLRQQRKDRTSVRNRCLTNLAPAVRLKVDRLAKERDVTRATMIRMLVGEALRARGFSGSQLTEEWMDHQVHAMRNDKEAYAEYASTDMMKSLRSDSAEDIDG